MIASPYIDKRRRNERDAFPRKLFERSLSDPHERTLALLGELLTTRRNT